MKGFHEFVHTRSNVHIWARYVSGRLTPVFDWTHPTQVQDLSRFDSCLPTRSFNFTNCLINHGLMFWLFLSVKIETCESLTILWQIACESSLSFLIRRIRPRLGGLSGFESHILRNFYILQEKVSLFNC